MSAWLAVFRLPSSVFGARLVTALPIPLAGPPRNALERAALRFVLCYLVLYAPAVPSTLGSFGLSAHWYDALWQGPVRAVASVIGLTAGSVTPPAPVSGAFEIAQVVLFALIAGVAAGVWTLRGRNTPEADTRLFQWTRIVSRYMLAFAVLHYGLITLFRYSFGTLTPEQLVTPLGYMHGWEDFWAFIGWSPINTGFLGPIEIITGLMLLRRETTLAGALIAGSILSNVLLVNFFFDVPGKSLSPHLAILTGVLIAPDAQRLINAHLLGRPVPAADLGRSVPSGLLATYHATLKAIVTVLFIAAPLVLVSRVRGHLFPIAKHPLAGLYDVRDFRLDGATIAPLLGDSVRWRRFVLTDSADAIRVQRLDGTWVVRAASVDTAAHQIRVSKARATDWHRSGAVPRGIDDTLRYTTTRLGMVRLEGRLDGHDVWVNMRPQSAEKFQLLQDPKP